MEAPQVTDKQAAWIGLTGAALGTVLLAKATEEAGIPVIVILVALGGAVLLGRGIA